MPDFELPCLSIHHEWLDLILRRRKRMELRSFSSWGRFGAQEFVIGLHAVKKTKRIYDNIAPGHIMAIAKGSCKTIRRERFAEHEYDHRVPAFPFKGKRCFGWTIRELHLLETPFPARGQQGLWYLRDEEILNDETVRSIILQDALDPR